MKLETQTEQLISETVTVYGLSPQIGVHALAQTVNALAHRVQCSLSALI